MSVSGTVLSKRKIIQLVEKKYVRGFDDPRLYTLPGLRRRGIPPGAILAFVNELGVTKSTTNIEIKRFETSVRRYLEASVPRLMLVLDPIKVIIDNLPDDHLEMIEMPFSKDPTYGVGHLITSLLDVRYLQTPLFRGSCLYSQRQLSTLSASVFTLHNIISCLHGSASAH